MKKIFNRVKAILIHRLGGFTEVEMIHADTIATRRGRQWMYRLVYRECKKLKGKSPKKAWPILEQWLDNTYKYYY